MKELLNKTILVTKAEDEAERSLSLLSQAGAEIIYFPTIKIVPNIDSPEVKDIAYSFNKFDYIVFTSTNAIEVFQQIIKKFNLDLSTKKVAAVGKSTEKKCKELNVNVDLMPDEFSARGLIKIFSEIEIDEKQILIPGSVLSSDELSNGLTELGAVVKKVSTYDVKEYSKEYLAGKLEQINFQKPDVFIFTSPSSFDNFCKIININSITNYFERSVICTIGTTTENAIRQRGLTVNIVPEVFSLNGVSEAIIKYFHITAKIA